MDQLTNNYNSKSILARLLAEENISIVHQNVQTACFDLETRTMILPIWKEMDGELYDLLTAHEVGHAKETPPEGWHSAIFTENADGEKPSKANLAFKSYLNVIEDARIEKLMKRRYPGLSRSFSKGYKSLHERDFFGISGVDVNNLKLIDRINIKFKLGSFIPVRFSDEEKLFVEEIYNLETWEQVVNLAERVYAHTKSKAKETKSSLSDLADLLAAMPPLQKPTLDENDEDSSEEDDGGDEDSSEEDDGQLEDFYFDENDQEKSQGLKSDETEPNKNDDYDFDEGSNTDAVFRSRESELVNSNNNVVVVELPECNLENIIIPNSVVISMLNSFLSKETEISYVYSKSKMTYENLRINCRRKFNNRNNKYIMHLVKEFESRKNANSYSRQLESKTGELNTNALHKYKFTNDLFKKITVVPKSKSHGLVMFLDMSDSMRPIFANTLEQLLIFASFCKKVNIPFDVYGFANSRLTRINEQYDKIVNNQNKFKWSNEFTITNAARFNLKHLISSSLNNAAYKNAFDALSVAINEYPRYSPQTSRQRYRANHARTNRGQGDFTQDWSDAGFDLGSTPLISTLLCSREIVANFNSRHGVDITNVLYLTDGAPSDNMQHASGFDISYKSEIILIDKKTKLRNSYSQYRQYPAVAELVRRVTGCKQIGYYLMPNSKHLGKVLPSNFSKMQIISAKSKLTQDSFYSVKTNGFDEYFFVKMNSSENAEILEVNSTMTKASLTSKFKMYQKSKTNSRVMVAKFAQSLASSL
jgi:hypothetical protein